MRFSGLGIANPSENSEREYKASLEVTKSLSESILQQERDFSLYNSDEVKKIVHDLKKNKEDFLKDKFENVISALDENTMLKRCLNLNRGKGVGSW